ncbi:uncharacterized protein BJ212DRAFT_1406335 [Suillus subaureus]|uniref:Uncharacterized protein n=1 Tax=Suillus subaureus TaxID=48587 RepID=A0A9P7DKQ7_9AGAM|nr:uncharacterized protein BJ212DRAFT_1406335 [Suillus subaureus]KAG1797237.1 hypothetical protein BJ212DRAFT_1406335 [Suillus subaureus]
MVFSNKNLNSGTSFVRHTPILIRHLSSSTDVVNTGQLAVGIDAGRGEEMSDSTSRVPCFRIYAHPQSEITLANGRTVLPPLTREYQFVSNKLTCYQSCSFVL